MSHSPVFDDKAFASFFVKLRKPVAPKVAKKIIEIASIKDRDSMLDLGCGPGLISKSIMRKIELSRVLLVDRSLEMIGIARKNLGEIAGSAVVRKVDLAHDNLKHSLGAGGKFDHIIAVDLWHLLEERRRLVNFPFTRLLSEEGNLTITLHKEISNRKLKVWHTVRSELRDDISNKIKERYPRFSFQQRSRGATVHRDEISVYVSELSDAGFKLVRRTEDRELADINQMTRHLPESFMIEVKRQLPKIESSFLRRVVNGSASKVLGRHKGFEESPIATEVFYVFMRS